MLANIEMNEGHDCLKKIIHDLPPDSKYWNEAQNRFQFIDRLLIECLGWQKPQIEVENTNDAGGRLDYILGKKQYKAVLEAKKEALLFDILPPNKKFSSRKLRPLISKCSKLQSACTQVISYCAIKGISLAIVCNGPQLIIFRGLLQGNPPLDGDCIIFDGFNAYIDHFSDLWTFLSPEGINEKKAYNFLETHNAPRIPEKASNFIDKPSGHRYRTDFQDNLRLLASYLLNNIEEDPSVKHKFYEQCYIPIDTNNRDLLLSKKNIESRYKLVSDNGILPSKINISIENGRLKLNETLNFIANGSAIVIVGDVGVGKTSFFENLYQQLNTENQSKICYIHINLGKEASLEESIKSYIINNLPSILADKYDINISHNSFIKKLYTKEIEDFDNSIYGSLKENDQQEYEKKKIIFLEDLIKNKSTHLKKSLIFIMKNYNRQIIIIIDNADQRTFSDQQEAFLAAQELASISNLLVFISLRPSTFYTSKLTGSLSGYKNEILTINPPPAYSVIVKRIIFALNVAEGRIAPDTLANVKYDFGNIVSFLKSMLRAIRTNKDINIFLNNITGGNIRLMLEITTSFCGSPNVESEKIVDIENKTNNYIVPLHEFSKHALLGEYSYYNSHSSLVAYNIFDITIADKKEHFLASLIIAYIVSPTNKTFARDGFITGANILEEMEILGFFPSQIRISITNMAQKRLIETPHSHFREIIVQDNISIDDLSFRATSIGIYHIKFWAGDFSFLDATAIDTPIFDEQKRCIVCDYASSFNINDRYLKAVAFKEYLESIWDSFNFGVSYYNFKDVLNKQNKTFESVKQHIQRKHT